MCPVIILQILILERHFRRWRIQNGNFCEGSHLDFKKEFKKQFTSDSPTNSLNSCNAQRRLVTKSNAGSFDLSRSRSVKGNAALSVRFHGRAGNLFRAMLNQRWRLSRQQTKQKVHFHYFQVLPFIIGIVWHFKTYKKDEITLGMFE